jgi:hypothetical protein
MKKIIGSHKKTDVYRELNNKLKEHIEQGLIVEIIDKGYKLSFKDSSMFINYEAIRYGTWQVNFADFMKGIVFDKKNSESSKTSEPHVLDSKK